VWTGLILAITVAGAVLYLTRSPRPASAIPEGYIDNPSALEQEFVRFYGQPLKDEAARSEFAAASERAAAGDFSGAVTLLENLVKRAAVPAVFNDLGVLYERIDDRARALVAFREALARDAGYQPVRANLQRLRGFQPGSADPVTHEVEPNGAQPLANVIPLNAPVEAAITGGNDVDSFRFTAPAAPRDILDIAIENRSKTLEPAISLYDSDNRLVEFGRAEREPGSSLVERYSPAPNATLSVQLWGRNASAGDYVLTIRPAKAFDTHEPNDEIFSATRISVGETVYAGIMDGRDTDYFSFVSPRAGSVVIEVENLSKTLIPAVSTFAPDMRFVAFGPDIRTPGQGLRHTMTVEDGKIYWVQVWTQGNSSGQYQLTLR
jgi:hypothetical protein